MDELITVTKEVVKHSSQISTWAIAVFGGTIATIISTSYIRPSDFRLRLSALLFIPGWVCLSFSIYYGEQLTRKYLATMMVESPKVLEIASDINNLFSNQRFYLLLSLVFFGAWLLVFLLQWVFVTTLVEEKK